MIRDFGASRAAFGGEVIFREGERGEATPRAADASRTKLVLNAGAGFAHARGLHRAFASPRWREVRLDIDPRVGPDIVASICDMGESVPDASFDAIWSSHAIEHLYAHEAIPAFREFRRVLRRDGFALVTCPNLAAVARLAATGDVESVIYQSAAGPIRALDMFFGLGRAIAEGRKAMAHKTGYTVARLARVALAGGFAEARVIEGPNYDLWAVLLAEDARLDELAPMFAGTNLEELFLKDHGEVEAHGATLGAAIPR